MSTERPPSWMSLYLYYTVDANPLLTNKVWPLIKRLAEEGLLKHFFFMRYGDTRGPHIRLRIVPVDSSARSKIRRRLKKAFPEGVFVPYVPETERYGGPVGILIAERLFEASSVATLQLLEDTPEWNYRRALASALQMHIGMLQAFDVSQVEAAALQAHIARSRYITEDSIKQFEQGFNAQRDKVAAPLANLWAACEQNTVFTDPWFRGWRKAMQTLKHDLHAAYKAGQLVLPESPHHDSPLWFLYESYIHMTNNRLRVTRQDESFAAHMLYRSLSPE
jgi:thiopeptide-type bacteriocin biosynthesis protein